MEHPPATHKVEPGGLWAKSGAAAPPVELTDLLADLRDDVMDRLERQEWMLRELLQQRPAMSTLSTSFLEAMLHLQMIDRAGFEEP